MKCNGAIKNLSSPHINDGKNCISVDKYQPATFGTDSAIIWSFCMRQRESQRQKCNNCNNYWPLHRYNAYAMTYLKFIAIDGLTRRQSPTIELGVKVQLLHSIWHITHTLHHTITSADALLRNYSLTHPLTHSLTHSLTQFTHSLTHCCAVKKLLTHILTHSLTHCCAVKKLLTHILTHSLTHRITNTKLKQR